MTVDMENLIYEANSVMKGDKLYSRSLEEHISSYFGLECSNNAALTPKTFFATLKAELNKAIVYAEQHGEWGSLELQNMIDIYTISEDMHFKASKELNEPQSRLVVDKTRSKYENKTYITQESFDKWFADNYETKVKEITPLKSTKVATPETILKALGLILHALIIPGHPQHQLTTKEGKIVAKKVFTKVETITALNPKLPQMAIQTFTPIVTDALELTVPILKSDKS